MMSIVFYLYIDTEVVYSTVVEQLTSIAGYLLSRYNEQYIKIAYRILCTQIGKLSIHQVFEMRHRSGV